MTETCSVRSGGAEDFWKMAAAENNSSKRSDDDGFIKRESDFIAEEKCQREEAGFYDEDIVDGFEFISCDTLDNLNKLRKKAEEKTRIETSLLSVASTPIESFVDRKKRRPPKKRKSNDHREITKSNNIAVEINGEKTDQNAVDDAAVECDRIGGTTFIAHTSTTETLLDDCAKKHVPPETPLTENPVVEHRRMNVKITASTEATSSTMNDVMQQSTVNSFDNDGRNNNNCHMVVGKNKHKMYKDMESSTTTAVDCVPTKRKMPKLEDVDDESASSQGSVSVGAASINNNIALLAKAAAESSTNVASSSRKTGFNSGSTTDDGTGVSVIADKKVELSTLTTNGKRHTPPKNAECDLNVGGGGGFVSLPVASSTAATNSPATAADYFRAADGLNNQNRHQFTPQFLPPVIPSDISGRLAAAQFALPTNPPSLPSGLSLMSTGSIGRYPLPPGVAQVSLPNFPMPPNVRKKGRWCGLHVQIAWDIHNDRAKHKRDKHTDLFSTPSTSASAPTTNGVSSSLSLHQQKPPSSTSLSMNSGNVAVSTSNAFGASHSPSKTSKHRSSSSLAKNSEHTQSNGTGISQDLRTGEVLPISSTHLHEHSTHRSRSDKEKDQSRLSESRASVSSSSRRTTPLDNKERVHSNSNNSRYSSSEETKPPPVVSSHQQQHNIESANQSFNNMFNAAALAATTCAQDGLLYRQKELQDRIQANSFAAALGLRGGLPMPPFPMSVQDNQFLPNFAAIQSQLNMLQQQQQSSAGSASPLDIMRLRLQMPPTSTSFGGFDGTRAAMLPLSDASLAYKQPQTNGQVMTDQQQQRFAPPIQANHHLLQRLQQPPAPYMTQNGANMNPLVSMLDGERGISRTVAPPMPNFGAPCFPNANGSLLDPMYDPSGALALYTNLLQRERMEMEQRNRMFGLLPPPGLMGTAGQMGAPGGNAAAMDILGRLGVFPSSMPMILTPEQFMPRNFAGVQASPAQQSSRLNPQASQQFSLSANDASSAQQAANNKLTNSPFSATLQQMARRESMLNSSPATSVPQNLQNR